VTRSTVPWINVETAVLAQSNVTAVRPRARARSHSWSKAYSIPVAKRARNVCG